MLHGSLIKPAINAGEGASRETKRRTPLSTRETTKDDAREAEKKEEWQGNAPVKSEINYFQIGSPEHAVDMYCSYRATKKKAAFFLSTGHGSGSWS